MFIDEAFRPFWAPGLNNISNSKTENLKNWINKGSDYQINSQITKSSFTISVYDRDMFLYPISADCNRFSTAAIESIVKIESNTPLPKSIGWTLIRQYYSAFYAAHLIIRLMGKSLTQLDGSVISSINKIADLYGNRNGINVENGYYLINYSTNTKQLIFNKIDVNKDGGSHVALWKLFGEEMKKTSSEMLTKMNTAEVQRISKKIDDLVFNLTYVGSNSYNWLSKVRNDINYRHEYGVWHPYSLGKRDSDYIKRNTDNWKNNLMDIELSNLTGRELIRFHNSCQFIIGLGLTICSDMEKRCSNGKSFLNSGYKKIIESI